MNDNANGSNAAKVAAGVAVIVIVVAVIWLATSKPDREDVSIGGTVAVCTAQPDGPRVGSNGIICFTNNLDQGVTLEFARDVSVKGQITKKIELPPKQTSPTCVEKDPESTSNEPIEYNISVGAKECTDPAARPKIIFDP